ncbi:MAG: hypothetical protein ACREFP_01025 [Acetobacteraceae bacterium]
MRFANRAMRLLLIICVLVATNALPIRYGEAYTPWGLVAHGVIGRVKHLSQKPEGSQPGFDVATVVLNADATKVYATAVSLLHRNQALHIVTEDPKDRTVEFSNGARSARITVIGLGTMLSQILVASAIKPGEDSATLRIVEGILHVCQAMKVTCSLQ